MRILLLNCVYREGSTGKIVYSLSEELRASGHEVLTCYGLGQKYYDSCSVKICTNAEHKFNALLKRLAGVPHGGIYCSNFRIERIISEFRPDVVHLHCAYPSVFNVYRMLRFLAKSHTRTVLTLHAEIMHTAGCEHAFECCKWKDGCHDCHVYRQRTGSWFFDRSRDAYRMMEDVINSFDTDKLSITAVSPWLAARARQSAIMRNYDVVYVPNGVDTSVFHYRENVGLIDSGQFKKTILFVTPYLSVDDSDNKGGRYISRIASGLPECKFVIVAGNIGGTVGRIPPNVQMWGRAGSQDELAQLYSEADVTLLLSCRETFSMVMAESLCCGTPVVGFMSGGPESVGLKDYCTFVEYGDTDGLVSLLISAESGYDGRVIAGAAESAYAKSVMTSKYYCLYESLKTNR